MSDHPPASGPEGRGLDVERCRVSDSDRAILSYMACHSLVRVSQVQTLLEVQEPAARERLDALAAAGLIRYGPRLRRQQVSYQVTALGLREIGSELSVPRVDLRRY